MGILARCGCGGGQCNCSITAGENITIGGSGSVANPYVINAVIGCEDVRPCISGTAGVAYDPATGVVSTHLSSQSGNNLAVGPDGGLFVPTGAATVSAGCGLSGDGSGSSPLAVSGGSWPYPCAPEGSGGVVVCGSDGVLRSEPRGQVNYVQLAETRHYANLTVPGPENTVVDTFSLDITNPDSCRSALVLVEQEVDVDFVLPPGAGACQGHGGDATHRVYNMGSSTIPNTHTQTTKLFRETPALGPGATITTNLPITLGDGVGGATYNRIQVLLRAILISL